MKENSKLTEKYLKLLAELRADSAKEKPAEKYLRIADPAKVIRKRKCK